MKKYIFSLVLLLTTIVMMAGIPENDNYVKTKNDIVYFSKITFGPTEARLILDNGAKMTLMNNEMIAYKKNGRIFERLPLYVNNKPTKREVFMEILKYTNGMKLYCFNTYSQDFSNPNSNRPLASVDEYYVYKNGKFHLQLDDKNYKTVFGFFGINASMK